MLDLQHSNYMFLVCNSLELKNNLNPNKSIQVSIVEENQLENILQLNLVLCKKRYNWYWLIEIHSSQRRKEQLDFHNEDW